VPLITLGWLYIEYFGLERFVLEFVRVFALVFAWVLYLDGR
jgi:hypothetical protein